jgi:hypothetical protein
MRRSTQPDQIVDRQIATWNVDQLATSVHLPEIDAEKAKFADHLGHYGSRGRVRARKEQDTLSPAVRGSSANSAAGS